MGKVNSQHPVSLESMMTADLFPALD